MSPNSGDVSTRGLGRTPFRWAGGKQWLSPTLSVVIGESNGLHVEPFAGAASLFFARRPKEAWLNDANGELVNAFRTIRDASREVAQVLSAFCNDSGTYYRVRNTESSDPVFRAARFIFLNRTSYGGIWRVNRSGQYNVPYGNRENAWIPSERDLAGVAAALSDVRITNCDFRTVLKMSPPSSIVYLDPPYAPRAAPEVEFNRYTSVPFGVQDHIDLASLANELAARGASVFVSLSAASLLASYSPADFRAYTTHAKRALRGPKGGSAERVEILLVPRAVSTLGAGWRVLSWSEL